MKTQAELVTEIEQLVDHASLSDVIAALALVCHEKAEHLLCNWQDKITAKVWDRAGTKIIRLSDDSSIVTLS
jgi:hypothetical protein